MALWTRSSFLSQFGEVASAHRASETKCFGELPKSLGYGASTSIEEVTLKGGVLNADQFYLRAPDGAHLGHGIYGHLLSSRELWPRRVAALQ